jgi:transcriptional regulator with XRE-family HTH domain
MNKREKVLDARTLLALNVLQLRTRMGVSQEKLAELAGFHRTYVSQVERRVANTTADNIQKIADTLVVPVSRLFQLPEDE